MKSISKHNLVLFFLFSICIFNLLVIPGCNYSDSPLAGKTICLDPGHGGTATTDSFRVGPSGEREEWINLRVALTLKSLLESKNCRVIITRTTDKFVPLRDRALLAVKNNADAFISIHHNATADTNVNFPIVYFHGNASENQASVQLGRCLINQLTRIFYKKQTPYSLVSDHTIFPESGTSVLRHSYGIPGIIGEASFFTHPPEEERLKIKEYNDLEAFAYYSALADFFKTQPFPINEKSPESQIPPYQVLKESKRMNPVALLWQEDYNYAVKLFNTQHNDSLKRSFELFSRSVASFPDSWLAGSAHIYRAQILDIFKRYEEAAIARKRVSEYYIQL